MHYPLFLLSIAALTGGCTAEPGQPAADANTPQVGTAAPVPPALAAVIDRINQAATPLPPAPPPPPGEAAVPAGDGPADPFAIRAQVLLARARFSPGVVDGQFGTNLKHAAAAYQQARRLPVSGNIDSQTWQALLAEPGAGAPAASSYTITAADLAGPFAPDLGSNLVKLAAAPLGPQFSAPVEALAERFHMSQALLRALNPQARFAAAGEVIITARIVVPPFNKGDVARIDVAKSDASVRAFDQDDKLIAFYPATVGSTERPSPSGTHKVVGVAWKANYTYDPAKLAWGPRSAGKLVIKPGPNNPVGTVWIDLNAPSYGLHGSPEPDNIGKTASHGCVRLTNWDAEALAAGIKPGVVVRFIGARRPI